MRILWNKGQFSLQRDVGDENWQIFGDHDGGEFACTIFEDLSRNDVLALHKALGEELGV